MGAFGPQPRTQCPYCLSVRPTYHRAGAPPERRRIYRHKAKQLRLMQEDWDVWFTYVYDWCLGGGHNVEILRLRTPMQRGRRS